MSSTMSSSGSSRCAGGGRRPASSLRFLLPTLLPALLLTSPLDARTSEQGKGSEEPVPIVLTGLPLHVVVQSLEFDAAAVRSAAEVSRRAVPPGCETQQRARGERRRLPWGLGWLHRYGRDVEIERGGVAPPSLYLRSPLLSGLYEPRDCPGTEADPEEECGTVSLVADDDAAIEIEVPLPQLGARNARQLRDVIRERIGTGQTVVLRSTDGEDFDLMPGAVREIDARACPVD